MSGAPMFRVVSTFAGCGGSSEGWRRAGFDVVAAVEYEAHAVETYRLNADPETVVIEGDIREVTGAELLEIAGGELDVLDGSPPCQSWSMAGSRELMDDPNGELFSEYVGLVEEVMPRVFVAENVAGLTFGLARIPLYRILRQLGEVGYSVHAQLIKAEWLGVPQTRHRLIILGLRDDLELDARDWFPRPLDRETTIADVLPDVARIVRLSRPPASHAEWREEASFAAHLPAPTLAKSGLGNASWDYIRVETTGGELRRPTLTELLALSTFPPDFQIPGTSEEQWARLGNSVPPVLMQAIAVQVRAALLAART